MLNIIKFRHVAIVVNSIELMLEFYIKTLGFVLKKRFVIASDDFRKGVGLPNAVAKAAHLTLSESEVTRKGILLSLINCRRLEKSAVIS